MLLNSTYDNKVQARMSVYTHNYTGMLLLLPPLLPLLLLPPLLPPLPPLLPLLPPPLPLPLLLLHPFNGSFPGQPG